MLSGGGVNLEPSQLDDASFEFLGEGNLGGSQGEGGENGEVVGEEELGGNEGENEGEKEENGGEKGEKLGESYTCLVFDNRGIGFSSAPTDRASYT